MINDIESEFYEAFWKRGNGHISSYKGSYTSNFPDDSIVNFISYLKEIKFSGKILDLGCGNGRHIIEFYKNGFVDVVGIDVSSSAIKLAKANLKNHGVSAKVYCGSVFDLPFNDDEFDLVVDAGLLHHIRKGKWGLYKSEVQRVLKNDGLYFLLGFSKNSGYIKNFTPVNKNWTVKRGHYNHFFVEGEFEAYFKNFSVLKSFEKNKVNSIIVLKTIYAKLNKL